MGSGGKGKKGRSIQEGRGKRGGRDEILKKGKYREKNNITFSMTRFEKLGVGTLIENFPNPCRPKIDIFKKYITKLCKIISFSSRGKKKKKKKKKKNRM